MNARIVPDMPEREYHAHPALSSTGARQILESPALFQYKQANPDTSPAFDLGTAVHTKILGTGWPVIIAPEEHLTASGNLSTKASTLAWIDEHHASGAAIITPSLADLVDTMAERVLAHTGARALLELGGLREASVFASDPDTGVECRARLDLLALAEETAVDLKSTRGVASKSGFGRTSAKYGYPVQEAHYTDVLTWVTGAAPRFLFIVVEKDPPHLVAVHEFDEFTKLAGAEMAATARGIYAECLATDTWPGYGDDVLTTDIPAWWFNTADQEEEITF